MDDNVIWLDPDALEALVGGLNDWTDMARHSCTDVHNFNKITSEVLVDEVDERTSAISLFILYVASLEKEAQDLKTRKDEAVAMNSEGIITNPDGMVGYFLPEGASDNAATVRAHNSQAAEKGKEDAQDLEEARKNGKSADGRTPEQILADIDQSADMPIYGVTFCKTYGVDNILGHRGRPKQFRNILCSASKTTGVSGISYDLVKEIDRAIKEDDRAVKEDPERPYYSSIALNIYLTSATDDDDGPKFDKDFLVQLAGEMEKFERTGHDYSPMLAYVNAPGRLNPLSDPLHGALYAMGNNPQAARDYLAPDGHVDKNGKWVGGPKARDRWEMLTSREWYNLNGLSAAMRSLSSMRENTYYPESSVDGKRATWAASQAIPYFADDKTKGMYTDTMKKNVAVMIANCADEVDVIAEPNRTSLQDLEGVNRDQLGTVIYRVVDDEDAAATVASGVSNYHSRKTKSVLDELGEGVDEDHLMTQYQQEAQTQGFIYGLSERRYKDLRIEEDEQKELLNRTMSLLNLGGTGVATAIGGPVGGAFYEGTSTFAQPIVVDKVHQFLGNEIDMDPPASSSGSELGLLEARAQADAANRGLVPDATFAEDVIVDQSNPANGPFSWYSTDSDGNPHITLSDPPTRDELDQMAIWADQVRNSPAGNNKVFGDDVALLDSNYDNGSKSADGIEVPESLLGEKY